MTLVARVVFALLVCATFGAFFAAQRVKSEPGAVQRVKGSRLCSPAPKAPCGFAFQLNRDDDVTVRVVDADDEPVRTLVDDRPVRAWRSVRFAWNGRTDAGRRARDGRYRLRVNLGRQGRSLVVPRAFRLDTTPPNPFVVAVGPERDAPELLPRPDGRPAEIRIASGRPVEVLLFRTDPDPSSGPIAVLPRGPGGRTATWDGTLGGAPARPGTYLVALRARDRAGNVGTSPRRLPPRAPYGERLGVRPGITVRVLGIQPPLDAPVVAGQLARVGVDARGRPYEWALRRAGQRDVLASGRATAGTLAVRAPRGPSGLHLLTVRAGGVRATVPLAVQGLRRRPVLVVLPAIRWLAEARVDEDGDGLPDTLGRGLPVPRARVLAGATDDLRRRVVPLLAFLDRERLRYDLTTDLALAAGDGPPLAGHRGVVLAGDERWLPLAAQRGLRAFVRRGGDLATFGIHGLRRAVRLTPRALRDPTTAAPEDAFGFRLRPLPRGPVDLTVTQDAVGLFGGDVLGTAGVFAGYADGEAATPPPDGTTVAAARTADGRAVLSATRVGRGLVVRVGLPELPARLARPGTEAALVRGIWSRLAR